MNDIISAELDEYERIARTDVWYTELVGSDIRRLVNAARGNKSSEILINREKLYDEIWCIFKTLKVQTDKLSIHDIRTIIAALDPYLSQPTREHEDILIQTEGEKP